MSKYHFNEIEAKWQKHWAKNHTFKAENLSEKPKYYVLDMFPYPSGAGLHVGHPLGYIASDVYARFKRHQGFNVLHPMGYDSFGLPAEQYAIQTGQHPAETTKVNIEGGVDKNGNEIEGYRKQLDRIGFSFDWSREVRTSNPEYYKWTQWIFLQLFESWYDKDSDKARSIEELRSIFSSEGNIHINAACDEGIAHFTASEWLEFSEIQKQEILLKYRLTYLAETEVNWCAQLGTVLANDEIVNGVSERGGYPVIRKKMKQWSMRITAYAQRLLDGLDKIDWPQPLKDSQTNWIGRSKGAIVEFKVLPPAPSKGRGDVNVSTDSKGRGAESAGYLTGNSAIIGTLLSRAKEMRKNPTKAESILWNELRTKKVGYKFRQQHPIDNYIVDFVCLSKRLIIEVDGEIHQYQLEKDGERELLLKEKKGFKILRFTNNEVINNLQKVVSKIESTLKVLPTGEDLGGDFLEHLEQVSIPPLGARGTIPVFTTRPDTIFGVSFMVLAPEHDLVSKITTSEQKEAVENYVEATAKRSERERMADVKTITGVFTGAYAEHPFTGDSLPVWIGDYVLAGYGTGAVMSVPCGDQRDYDFAKHFKIPIPNIFKDADISEEAYSDKENTTITNSDFLNDLSYSAATEKIIAAFEEKGVGEGKINYRLRDAVFSRQRYWGEPFPIYYKDGMPHAIPTECLPLRLPDVEKYLPTEEGEPPLGRAEKWHWDERTREVVSPPLEGSGEDIFPLELNTMPGWAGSSWYFFRYMESGKTESDSKRDEVFASKEALNYWKNVDLYIGGSEHATGHLLYSRFWVKFMHDRGFAPVEEPFKKLINQGMILGESAFVYRVTLASGNVKEDNSETIEILKKIPNFFISYNILREKGQVQNGLLSTISLRNKLLSIIREQSRDVSEDFLSQLVPFINDLHVDVSLVNIHNELDIEAFRNSREEYKEAIFISEKGIEINNNNEKYIVSREVEKMSKSKYNVVNPDDICEQYGADTLRLYEMFLGPLEQAKPWNTAGITGVHGFLKKLWKLYHSGPDESFYVTDSPPSEGQGEDLKTLHKTIKKTQEDIENFSFNTSVSSFMIAVNELTAQKCNSKDVLEPLAILISPYAPHIAEELWRKLGHSESISTAPFPKFEEKYLVESSKEYPISFNGKMRFTLELPLDLNKDEIETAVMAHEKTAQYLEGRTPKKVIIVPGKIVNIVG
ncbi:leucine--tRNA ligase [Aequorivita lipolytica]|uniref:Leucine--tRNA ligase n=1 Tax=Aequorivita lipolytica TaxID=153267 RepID=A0A5C6YR22_9FLAO|nr:class I tRNA ligase family protein [Aequorivita lipolytica]TXD69302.1 leucine--tRNA ligase [Aequorivita lipolytica]SRX50076.1 Leucine--tRNA ligase [Aequorivita lipolytica]